MSIKVLYLPKTNFWQISNFSPTF